MVIKANAEVWTKDGTRLGTARRWHYRPEQEVHPEDLLFAAYLEVENFELGDAFFVPDVYLAGHDGSSDRVVVDATMKQVEHWTWTRMPGFVARLRGREALLPEETLPGTAGS
jgi:hypothetical protein